MPATREDEDRNNDADAELDFSRDSRVYVERYTASELGSIARLIRARKAFRHLLKRSRVKMRLDANQTMSVQPAVVAETTPSTLPLKMVIQIKQALSTSSSDDSEDSNIEDDVEEPFVDDEVFSKVFKPIISSSLKPNDPSLNMPNYSKPRKLSRPTQKRGSPENSLCEFSSTSASSSHTTPESPIGLEAHVDEETFTKAFRRVPLGPAKRDAQGGNPADSPPAKPHYSRTTKAHSHMSVLFAPMSIDSKELKPPIGVFLPEPSRTFADETEESLSVQAAVHNLVESVVIMEQEGKPNRDGEGLLSVVDPFASVGLKTYLKRYRDSKAKSLKLIASKPRPVDLPQTAVCHPEQPSTSFGTSSTKGRLRQTHKSPRYLNAFCDGISPARKSKQPKAGQLCVPEKSNTHAPLPPAEAASASTVSSTLAQVAEPSITSDDDLVLHTVDARTHPEWRDARASRVLRRALLFVKKGGRISVSRYAPDFASITVTQNSAIYTASAVASVDDVVSREREQRLSELPAQCLASAGKGQHIKVETNERQKELVARDSMLSSSSKQPKKVRRLTGDTKTVDSSATTSTQIAQRVSDDVPPPASETLATTTRRGRTIKRASRFSDYLVGNTRLPTKRSDKSKEQRASKEIEICPEQREESRQGGGIADAQQLAAAAAAAATVANATARSRVGTRRRIPPHAVDGGLGKTAADWGRASCAEPFMSSGDDDGDELDEEQVPERKYVPPPHGVIDKSPLGGEMPARVFSGGQYEDGTIAPVMFPTEVEANSNATPAKTITIATNTSRTPRLSSMLPAKVHGNGPCSSVSMTGAPRVRKVLINPAMGITAPEELAAIVELNQVLYGEPCTVTIEQIMRDVRKSLSIELRNHEQLIRWKKFLTMRKLEMRARLSDLRKAHKAHCPLSHHLTRAERAQAPVDDSIETAPSGASYNTSSNRCRGPKSSQTSATMTQPAGSAPVVTGLPRSKRNVSSSSSMDAVTDSSPAKIRAVYVAGNTSGVSQAVVDMPPPSLVVHPIEGSGCGQTDLIVPVSPIIPAGETFKLASPIAASASREYAPLHHHAVQAPPAKACFRPVASSIGTPAVVGHQPLSRAGKIVVKPIGRNVAGSPPRIIRRLIPINRTSNGVPIVTPLSLSSANASGSQSTSQGVSLLRRVGPGDCYSRNYSRATLSAADAVSSVNGEQPPPVAYLQPLANRPGDALALDGANVAKIPDSRDSVAAMLSVASTGVALTSPHINAEAGVVRISAAGATSSQRRKQSFAPPTTQYNGSMPPPLGRPPKAKVTVSP